MTDRLIRITTALAVVAVAVVAAIISYQHAYELVRLRGESGVTVRLSRRQSARVAVEPYVAGSTDIQRRPRLRTVGVTVGFPRTATDRARSGFRVNMRDELRLHMPCVRCNSRLPPGLEATKGGA